MFGFVASYRFMFNVYGGQMVIVPTFHTGGRDLIPQRVETSGSVSVYHSLTTLRCKIGTIECGEDRFECNDPLGM